MDNELLSIAAAARKSGLSSWRVRAAVLNGDLSAVAVNIGPRRTHYRINPADLARWMESLKVARRA